MKIAVQQLTTVFALALLLGAAPSAFAKGEQLSVTEVAVDFNADTLTITGKDFDHKKLSDLSVFLGEFGDITALCSGPPAPTATVIVCDFFSLGGLPADGDYRYARFDNNDGDGLTMRAGSFMVLTKLN